MADLAAIFHWPPATMDALSLPDLMRWHEQAVDRFKAMNGVKD